MDPVLAGLIKVVSLDLIKIMGPAIVAAFATYKVTKIQFEIKLKELEKSQGFKARENLLEHYKHQKEKTDEGYASLSQSLGYILGYVSGDEDEKIDETTGTFVGISDMYLGMAPFDIRMALRDMASMKLNDMDEYRKLESYISVASGLEVTRSLKQLKTNIYTLLEIYSFLGRCHQIMLETQIHSLFEGYVNDA